jgi:hypothetical protein
MMYLGRFLFAEDVCSFVADSGLCLMVDRHNLVQEGWEREECPREEKVIMEGLVDEIQVHKVEAVSQSKSSNVWI